MSNHVDIITKLTSLENQYQNELITGDLSINSIKFVLTFIGPDADIAFKKSRSFLSIHNLLEFVFEEFVIINKQDSFQFIFKAWLKGARFAIVKVQNNFLFFNMLELILFNWSNRINSYHILLFNSN